MWADDVGEASFERAHGLHRGLAGGLLGVEVGTSLGRVPQLDDGHDVQCPIDAPVPGPGEPVTFLVTGGGVQGAVPFQEANLSRSAKRWMSPTSTSNRAAPEGPIPVSSMRVEPRAARSSRSSSLTPLIFLWMVSSSVISSTASRRRVLPTMSRGLMVAIIARALCEDKNFGAPPGKSSNSNLCRRLMVCVRALAELVATIHQHGHHYQFVLDLNPHQVRSA
jgi:hypothetical protein